MQIFDWLKNLSQSPQTNNNISERATIRVVGDRASGKTTYMAALARWPNANLNSPVQDIVPINEDGNTLISIAQNILEQGLEIEPTFASNNVMDLKDYQLRIILKRSFSLRNPRLDSVSQQITLDINCKDYAGEFFSDLLNKIGDPVLNEYINDCLQASGIMVLIDGTSRKYQDIAASIDKFLVALDNSNCNNLDRRKLRIALVVTKCEQPDLWVNRQRPKEITRAISSQVLSKLQAWQQSGRGSVEYFSASAFGMLGTNSPAPNFTKVRASRDGLAAIIKDPKRWRPFGLVSPIYWLCTGERLRELDGE
jgi:GTPase SAR1 family protein